MKKIICFFLPVIFLLGSVQCFSQNKSKQAVFASSSNQAMMHFNEGIKYSDLNEYIKAREHFLKAVEQDPKFFSAYLFLADNASNAGEFMSHLNKAKLLSASANDWEKMYYNFLETGTRNDLNGRLKIAEKMVMSYPQSARAHFLLGDTYLTLHKTAQARAEFTKAIQHESAWPTAHMALANSYMTDNPKDLKKAEAIATSLVKLSPETNCHLLLGDVYRQQNEIKKAEETYTKAIMSDPESPAALAKRGHARVLLGDYAQARSDFEQAAKLEKNPVGSKQFYAFSYLYEGMTGKAYQELVGFAENTTDQDEAAMVNSKLAFLSSAAMIALHMYDVQKLESVIQMLEPLRTRNALIIGTKEAEIDARSGELYWKAMYKLLKKDVNAAKAYANQLKSNVEPINNVRKFEQYEFLSGYISFHEGDFATAVSHLENSNPSAIYQRYWLARAYESAGMKEKAMKVYSEIADFNFSNVGNALVKKEVLMKVNK